MDNILNQLIIILTKFPAYLPFTIILVIVALILYKAHKSSENKFSIFDLIQDKDTGKGSLEKIAILTGYLTLTWWFVDLAVASKATVDDALAYGGIMGLTKVFNSWISAKYSKPTDTAQ